MLQSLPERLLPWFEKNRRDLPWRRDRKPYHVWLSEIMLQQTRVEAVKGYYERFLQRLPTIEALAAAEENELLKLWEGLGYYSRVRNLQKAAQHIVRDYCGAFPHDYESVRALPGIGAYTAGAICSICFEQPTAAVDGNVLRVVSRVLASDQPIGEERVKRSVKQELEKIYPEGRCGDFTQALMELGATVCLPNGAPLCGVCPLRDICKANLTATQERYPVRAAKKPRRVERRTVFFLECGDKIAVCKRPKTGLLAGLWQLPDVPGELSVADMLRQAETWGVHPRNIRKTVQRTHIFTHVEWKLTCCYLDCAQENEFTWVTRRELEEIIGLPTAYRQFLTE
ncbi:MAG: A/G-specific adenine glycosylase [Oscillospiraceae bacterium]|nr:A/G-specific adenine glycosylase [Oscillospiraceae bacterium]